MLSVYRHQIVVRVQSPDYCTCTESKLMCVYRVQSVVGLQIVVSVQGPDFCRVKSFFVFRDQIAVRAKRQNYIVQRPDCCQNTETRLLSEYRDHIVVRVQRLDCCQCTEESISLCVQRTTFCLATSCLCSNLKVV